MDGLELLPRDSLLGSWARWSRRLRCRRPDGRNRGGSTPDGTLRVGELCIQGRKGSRLKWTSGFEGRQPSLKTPKGRCRVGDGLQEAARTNTR